MDINKLAADIVGAATGREPKKRRKRKNPAAVALGRKGGVKGGRARAESLSPEQRSEIAKAAAISRWNATKKTET
jgi:hypothetical protein